MTFLPLSHFGLQALWNLSMGNAVTNPVRFLEKKVLHEQFGMKDPKFPDHNAVPPASCDGDWQNRRDAEVRADFLARSVGQVVGAGGSDLPTMASRSRIFNSYGHCK
jgi:hypothetical protein